MTDPDRTESSEPASQPATEEESSEPATEEETDGINLEDAEKKAGADYQQRLQEFDNVETTPVVSVPSPGEAGKVEIPKS